MQDKDLITGIIKKQKDLKDLKDIAFKKQNPTSNIALINKIINFIRGKGQPCTSKQIKLEYPQVDLRSQEFISYLSKSEKIKYNPEKDIYELKSKYNISNINELKLLFKSSENGIPYDEELKDSYLKVVEDIDLLIKEKKLRIIYNEEKKLNILFHRDLNDPIEHYLINDDYKATLEEIRTIWKNELKHHEGLEKYAPMIKKSDGKLLKKKRKEGTRIRQSNTHLLDYDNKPLNMK